MGLDDEREKLRQADEWLRTELAESERFQAALIHVALTAQSDEVPESLRYEAARILRDMGAESHGTEYPS